MAETLDIVVVGGGINGAGIARDAAGRGLSVLLCEKSDLASATSSASTKLIHGGLRYLEYYEFRLVREALIEREVLLRAAPHIIWPLRFVLPHNKGLRPACAFGNRYQKRELRDLESCRAQCLVIVPGKLAGSHAGAERGAIFPDFGFEQFGGRGGAGHERDPCCRYTLISGGSSRKHQPQKMRTTLPPSSSSTLSLSAR